MGLLDQLAGQMLGGGNAQGGNTVVQLVLALINNTEGGLPGLLDKLQAGGLAAQVASWLGNGANQSVSAGALTEVLGAGTLGQLAGQFGMSEGEVAGGLAAALPSLVDKLSPEGEISGDNALFEQGLSMLGGLFASR